jgi:predicted dienelactone hydrolase
MSCHLSLLSAETRAEHGFVVEAINKAREDLAAIEAKLAAARKRLGL